MTNQKKNDTTTSTTTKQWPIFMGVGIALIGVAWQWSVRTQSSSSASELPTMDRVLESQLGVDKFVKEYVQTGTPVILVRDNKYQERDVLTSFLKNCGHIQTSGIPLSVQNVFRQLSEKQWQVACFLMHWLLGVDLQKWKDMRQKISIQTVEQVARSDTSLKQTMPIYLTYLLPSFLSRILELFLRPLYLGDAVFTTSQLQQECGVHIPYTKQEEHARTFNPATTPDQDYIWLFWGGIDSSFYPLHRDNNDNDIFVDVVEGCKEFVIVSPDEHSKLYKIPIPGADIWQEDFFDHPNKVGLVRAWKGTIRKGETLFMPGDSIHEARNHCPNTVSLSRRPWSSTIFRTIQLKAAHIYGGEPS